MALLDFLFGCFAIAFVGFGILGIIVLGFYLVDEMVFDGELARILRKKIKNRIGQQKQSPRKRALF